MEQDLETALVELFGRERRFSGSGNETVDYSMSSVSDLVVGANDHYEGMVSAMKEGDWDMFGENFDALGEVLGELSEE